MTDPAPENQAPENQAPENQAPENQAPEDQPKPVRGEALDTDDGVETPGQQPTGPGNREGGGEWPDPHATPQAPAPGAVDDDPGS